MVDSLGDEKISWQKQVVIQKARLKQVVGDMLLCVGYMTYMGIFSGKYRRQTLERWFKLVERKKIIFDKQFSFSNIMGDQVEIINWVSNGLPNDDVSKENMIMLKVSDYFPLIIDPQKQALQFLNVYESDRQ